MKIKKFFASALAVVITAVSVMLPSSAAAVTLTFSNANDVCYGIKVTAQAVAANINFEVGDTISVTPYENQTVVVTGGNRTAYGTVKDVTFLGSPLTQGITNCQFFGGDNKFVPGYINNFTWTGTIILNDKTLHPVNELGISLSSPSLIQIPMTINAASLKNQNYLTNHTIPVTSAEVVTVDNEAVIYSGSTLYLRDYLNDGFGLATDEKAKLKNGTDFRLVVNLSDMVTSQTSFSLRTSLNTAGITAYAYRGDRKVVFDNLPLAMFYDKETSEKFSTEVVFENLRVTGGTSYTSMQLTFTDNGAAATTTTPKATTAVSTTKATQNTTTATAQAEYDEEVDPEDITEGGYINYPTITLNPGASAFLKTDIDPQGLKRTTTSRSICNVYTSGRILAGDPGTATITIRNTKGQKVTCKVVVKNSVNPITKFALNTTSGVVYKGLSYSLAKHTKTPTVSTDTITWSTSNPAIATVTKDGKVTIVGTGTVQITALASSGRSSTAKLTARNPFVTISSGTSKSIKVGGKHTINAKVGPASSKLTYSSSASSVARVDSKGVVTGVKKGTANIIVRSSRGATATVKITVS